MAIRQFAYQHQFPIIYAKLQYPFQAYLMEQCHKIVDP
jgi:hypothetical protein